MTAYMIGIDIGTTSTKAVLYDEEGAVIDKAQQEYQMLTPTIDTSEENPEVLFDAVVNTLQGVISKQRVQPEQISLIAFSAQMHSLILVDQAGKPLTNSITWADNRARYAVEDLKNNHQGQQIYERTGTPIHAMSPLCKMWWLKNDEPALYAQAARFVDIKSYIIYRLTGEWVMDESIASATGLYNLWERDWDAEVLALLELTTEQLPKLVSTQYICQAMDAGLANQIGVRPTTPLVIGASDGVLSNLGVNSYRSGEVAVTIGTSGAIRTVVDRPLTDSKGRIFCYVLDDTHYVIGGPVNNGGVVLRWLRDELLASEVETAKRLGMDSYDVMTRIAERVAPGSQGLMFHPYLAGERAPLWTSDARGSFIGLTLAHKKEHMIRAVLEGVLFNLYTVYLALVEVMGEMPSKIHATGGFSKSALWRQMMADIFDCQLEVPESYESSCLGACAIGSRAIGKHNDYSMIADWVGKTHAHEPNQEYVQCYQELASIFIQVSRDLVASYESIAKFQRTYYKVEE
ncbi:gluconokinase [Staphylococcus americanisciuri]|uniref:Gluconokinase n=1 Tax=Staphylococcus americanisciuri TaxID=2973940 RepID=A0ABT2F393_9STAP|nr:gluconokinase [Staphylococcus americanisciuri]MCS4486934.1 gluconokinase [Staphylococcus americanisciuri]